MKIFNSITDIIGKTPLVEFKNIEEKFSLKARLVGKIEYLNPAGSIKDRVAFEMIKDAEEKGILNKDSVIIEPTSGNTGIGLAAIGASKGIRTIIVMPETMSIERRKIMLAYGAELVLTEGAKGMAGAIEKAEELKARIPGGFIPGQFVNKANPKAHENTTGPEIWEDTEGKIDILVSAVGTGGTISGTGTYLKSKNPKVKVTAVEPDNSPILSGGTAGAHKIQGIGAGFIPETLDTSIYDEVIRIKDEEAFEFGRELAKTEGFLVGISSGAALCAAIKEGKKEENTGKLIVVLLPDTGDRYLSTEMFDI